MLFWTLPLEAHKNKDNQKDFFLLGGSLGQNLNYWHSYEEGQKSWLAEAFDILMNADAHSISFFGS